VVTTLTNSTPDPNLYISSLPDNMRVLFLKQHLLLTNIISERNLHKIGQNKRSLAELPCLPIYYSNKQEKEG
jgi:hypothetical protein